MDEEKNISKENVNSIKEEDLENPDPSQLDYETDSSTNSDGTEKCPICLLSFESQEIGKPEVCSHSFCFPCIFEWSKVVKTCPIDRREFNKIVVFENLDSAVPLRSTAVSEQISLKEFTNGESEYTPCEICSSAAREDVMLLCDGCDKGFHIYCLNPPLSEIPEGNWYCVDCDNTDDDDSSGSEELEEEADADEIYDLQNEIEEQIGQLPATRLRNRQQPQIIRTLQSERIRNAILARRALRSNTTIQQDLIPSTSSSCTAPTRSVAKKAPAKKRKSTRRRARRVTRVVEYEIKDGQKFPVKTTRVVRRKKRKSRKIKKARRTVGRKVCGTSRSSIAASFKNANASVYDLQKDRQSAGLSNFNIFEPTNQLDYVPDEDMAEEFESQNSAGSTLIQSVVNYTNPFRRQALIKKRVINNFTTTSSDVNLIDLILNQHSAYDAFNKLSKESAIQKVKKSTTDHNESTSQAPNNNQSRPSENYSNYNSMSTTSSNLEAENISNQQMSSSRDNNEDNFNVSTSAHENITVLSEKKSPQKKKKSATFDMFGDSPDNQENKDEEEGPQIAEVCPNFSIYGNRNSDENLANVEQQDETIEENLDLVQMSDGEHNISEDIEPAVIRSQPASPDLENDINEQLIPEERSYTPPLVVAKDKTPEESVEKRTSNSGKKDRDHHKKHRRRELERYNVRERFKSPKRVRDRFGRNRTRSRSHSNERHKARKSRSFSRERDRDRHRSRNKKSKTPEKRRRRSYSRSPSSNERDRNSSKHHKSKHKKSYRKSRSATPQKYRDKSPRRRDRSASDKSKKKKRRNRSPEKPSAHTKEVFASGQNILVSVNFNNQDEKRSSRSKSGDNDETVVDITAKKKINVNSKPVAIIDLARSPFKELTPEYKKESNVIELSDSEGEKYANNANKAPKSPDSTKLYDPFDILNSPSNENVSSSQTTATTTTLKALGKNSIDFTNKLGPAIIKNLNIPLISNNEENLVSSSSSINNIFEKVFPPTPIASNSKIEVLQNEVIQIPSIATVNNATIESPYSPGNDYDDAQCHEMEVVEETNTNEKQTTNIFDDLFGSSTPPFLEKAKSTKKSADPDKYLNKLKRQERVIEEVKMVIKPYYSKRIINKDQYKEIMRKAVPKICHNKSGEINPTKIKHLIDSYVKFYTHKKRNQPEEIF